ncbi:MAG: arsenate reductase ArsC [Dehalococcoidia bacterium]|nr:arsenate reductase ArsC [Dehalococcoidia bacterium]
MTRVLFLCTGNSARSQIAEALLRAAAGEGWDVRSAGTDPAGLNPLTVEVMAEAGIDVSGAESKHLDRFREEPWDYVITVCDEAAESCSAFPGGRERLNWSTPDPAVAVGTAEARRQAFRSARESLRARIGALLRQRLDAGGGGGTLSGVR